MHLFSMDVIFELQRGRTFSIEVGFFDTVLEIKEKIQKYQNIPISKQTLFFNGQVLHDDGDVWKCEILQNSRIHLHIDTSSDHKPPSVHDDTVSTKFNLNIKTASKTHFPLEIDKNGTVLKLKERIHEIMEGTGSNAKPFNSLVLHIKGTELNDNNQFLRDCDNVSDNCEIEVSFKVVSAPPPTPAVTTTPTVVVGGGGSSKNKLKLMVLAKSGTKTIPVEVNATDNVGELRKELNKLQQNQNQNQRVQFHLPPEGYFFIYKQGVMNDDKSFRWHHVAQGDTIEIFKGCVTGGS